MGKHRTCMTSGIKTLSGAIASDRIGVQCIAYASDYPHEVDGPAAMHEIGEVAEREDLTDKEKQAVLADKVRRFFKL